jgi:hypothetical protein
MSWKPSKKRRTKRIDNGEFFIELQAMTQGDKDDLLDKMMSIGVDKLDKKQLQEGNTSGAQMHLGAMRHFKRVRSIKSWNLRYWDDEKDAYGDMIPLSSEAVRELPPEIVAEIDQVIDELNPDGLSEEKKSE